MDDDRYFARKTPRQGRSRALVDAVLVAAGRILGGRGEDVSTHDIARDARVSIGSLYQYFPSKEAIFGALIDYRLDEDTRLAHEMIESLDGDARGWIEHMTTKMVELHRQVRPLYRAMIPLVGPMRRRRRVEEAMAGVRRALQKRLEEERRDELRKDDLDIPVFLAGHAMQAWFHAILAERPELLDDPRLTGEMVDFIARYLLRDEDQSR